MKLEITMRYEREVVHSVLYKSSDKKLTSIYIGKGAFNSDSWPREIKVILDIPDQKNG